jgi:tetratricopeptide (TPR) repeat protein
MPDEPLDESQPINTGGGSFIGGSVETGGGDFVGRDKTINVFQYIVRHPQDWPGALWRFLTSHYQIVLLTLLLEVILGALFFRFRNLYLIPLWLWVLTSVLLLALIWGWYFWYKTAHTTRGLLINAFFALGFVSLVGWQAWLIAFPRPFATDVFGIAMAELGEGPDFHRTGRAREISGQIYERLCSDIIGGSLQANKNFCAILDESPGARSLEIRRIGVVADTETAKWFGQEINAHIVIWGQLLTSDRGRATIRFQLIEIPDRAVNPIFPIVLPVTTKSQDPEESKLFSLELDLENDPVKLKEAVTQQSRILSAFILGLSAYFDRNYLQAIEHFERAADTLPEDQPGDENSAHVSPTGEALIYFYLGRTNHALGNIEEGQSYLMRAQAANPEEPAIPLGLALGYGSLGREDEKGKSLDRSLELLNRWLGRYPDDAEARYDRGIIFQILDKHQDAIFDFERALQIDPDFYIAFISLAQSHSELGRYEQAFEVLPTAISQAGQTGINPSWAHLNLAIIYEKANKPEEANREYLEAINLAPESSSMYYHYARFLEKQGQMDAALEIYRQMLPVSHDKGWAYGTLAGFLSQRNLLDEALKYYQLAVHEKDEDALLHANLADTYFRLGQVDRALQEFEIAIQKNDQIPYIHAVYAGALFQEGEYARAAEFYEQALSIQPSDSKIMLNLGTTYERLEDFAAAEDLYLTIIENSDNYPPEDVALAEQRLQALR